MNRRSFFAFLGAAPVAATMGVPEAATTEAVAEAVPVSNVYPHGAPTYTMVLTREQARRIARKQWLRHADKAAYAWEAPADEWVSHYPNGPAFPA